MHTNPSKRPQMSEIENTEWEKIIEHVLDEQESLWLSKLFIDIRLKVSAIKIVNAL